MRLKLSWYYSGLKNKALGHWDELPWERQALENHPNPSRMKKWIGRKSGLGLFSCTTKTTREFLNFACWIWVLKSGSFLVVADQVLSDGWSWCGGRVPEESLEARNTTLVLGKSVIVPGRHLDWVPASNDRPNPQDQDPKSGLSSSINKNLNAGTFWWQQRRLWPKPPVASIITWARDLDDIWTHSPPHILRRLDARSRLAPTAFSNSRTSNKYKNRQ